MDKLITCENSSSGLDKSRLPAMASIKVEPCDDEVAQITDSAPRSPPILLTSRRGSVDSDHTPTSELRESSDSTDKPKKPDRECHYCHKTFSCASLLKVHLRVHTGEKPFVCNICTRAFSQSGTLRRHQLIHKQPSNKHSQKTVANQCNVCKKQLPSAASLDRHLAIHKNHRPYSCSDCGKKFANSSILISHKRIHSGEKPYQCDVCLKSFTQNGTLKRHKMVHSGERPFSCNLCDWRGTQLFLLMQHKRSHHFGEKPYSCPICHKTFSFSSSLQLHQRTHTGEKPYKCEYCSKSFTQNGSLNRHKLNNHNIMTKRQWQNRCFQDQIHQQQEQHSLFPKLEAKYPTGALPPISGPPSRLPDASALMLKAGVPVNPHPYGDLSHLTRYMQAYHLPVPQPDPRFTAGDVQVSHAAMDNWMSMSKAYNDHEPISPETNNRSEDSPSRHSLQSPASAAEGINLSPALNSPITGKDPRLNSPIYSKEQPRFDQDVMDYSAARCPSPASISEYNEKKESDRSSMVYLPHEYVNDLRTNRPESEGRDKFNSSQSAESGYLSPPSNTDTEDNSSTTHETPVKTSNFPRITDPIKRLGNKSRSGSREKLSLDQTISRLSGRTSVDSNGGGGAQTPIAPLLPPTNLSISPPVTSSSPKPLGEFSTQDLLNQLYYRGTLHHCEHCQVFFLDAAMYFIHRGAHDPHHPLKCSLCGFCAKDKYDFTSHFLEHKK